jgi:hypothetical protein
MPAAGAGVPGLRPDLAGRHAEQTAECADEGCIAAEPGIESEIDDAPAVRWVRLRASLAGMATTWMFSPKVPTMLCGTG